MGGNYLKKISYLCFYGLWMHSLSVYTKLQNLIIMTITMLFKIENLIYLLCVGMIYCVVYSSANSNATNKQ